MTREQYFATKAELKELASMIKIKTRNYRAAQSEASGGNKKGVEEPKWTNDMSLWRARHEFRHKHIVMSLIRGKTREQIEKPKDNNLPSEQYIQKLLETYEVVQQAVCVSS
jgi:hypothetical protein